MRKYVVFESPNISWDKDRVTEADLDVLKTIIIDRFSEFWDYKNGSSDGYFDYYVNEIHTRTLWISSDPKYGLCMFTTGNHKVLRENEYYTLGDPSKLYEMTRSENDYYCPAGLFLPPEEAWKGIEYFIRTGERSPELTWVTYDDLPDEVNQMWDACY